MGAMLSGACFDRGGRSESVVNLPDKRVPLALAIDRDLPPSVSHRRNTHVRITKRSSRYAALAVGLAFIAASCGSDSTSSNATTGGTTGGTTAAPETTAAAAPETTAGGTETSASSGG